MSIRATAALRAVVATGAFVRLQQFAAARPLWSDEAMLALMPEIARAPITSVQGVAVLARWQITGTRAGSGTWDADIAGAILDWVSKQTGRDEYVGAMNYEKVGVA